MRRLLLILAVILVALLGLYVATMPSKTSDSAKGDVGVLIGGDFSLVNHQGQPVRAADYQGKLLLIYFGFTYCPDVCPTELQKISAVLDQLSDRQRAGIVPLFVTVDPERDTVEQMALYLSNFHPAIVGLTGSVAQVKEAASMYKIYMQKVEDETSSASYTMDHSNLVYLMDGDNHYLKHFTGRATVTDMLKAIKAAL
ncbi:MAG: SCO family protein [Alphaproteobacteria bacterium]